MKLLLICLQLVSVIQALAPPHPDAEQNIHEAHRSLKGSYHHASAAPRLVNAALCNGMSEAECLDLDQEFEEQARKLRRIYQTTGYLKVLVVCVRFSNHAERGLPTQEQYDAVFNSPGTDPLYADPGSVKNYLEQNSVGTLEVDFGIMPWKTTNNTEAFYSYDKYGVTREFGVSKHSVMDQLEADGVNWTDYDLDGDGYIDAMVLLHSGYQAEVGNIDCYTGAQGENRIWSHAIANPSKRWTSPSSGIQTDNYAVAGGMRGVCRNRVPTIGVVTHELLHNLGLPDLNDNKGDYIGRGLGHYSIMSNPFGIRNFGQAPCHLTPWEKISLGWLDPIEIDTNGRYEIRDSETTADVYIIKKNYQFNGDEYLLIENRQPKLFDENLWNGGILIWHIDDTARQMYERGYPGQEGWPSNNKHYQMALLSPDGRYDLEVGRNSADSADFWTQGMEIGPGLVEPIATNAGTYPNTNSYQFGIIANTGIRLYDISASGDMMSFSVEGLGEVPATIVPATSAPTVAPVTSAPTVSPTTSRPTDAPITFAPVTDAPTFSPSEPPSVAPTQTHSLEPSLAPTRAPVAPPTDPPSPRPSLRPSVSVGPTLSPSGSNLPSGGPSGSNQPSLQPSGSSDPSAEPSSTPSVSSSPSYEPSLSLQPSTTVAPSNGPTTSYSPSEALFDTPRIPTFGPDMCREAGQPCENFVDCCSRRCNYSGENYFCFGFANINKADQKLSNGGGGAGAGSKR